MAKWRWGRSQRRSSGNPGDPRAMVIGNPRDPRAAPPVAPQDPLGQAVARPWPGQTRQHMFGNDEKLNSNHRIENWLFY